LADTGEKRGWGEWVPKKALGCLVLLVLFPILAYVGWHTPAFIRKVVHFRAITDKTEQARKAADLGKFEDAVRLATEVLEFDPGSDARLIRAWAYASTGHRDLAGADIDTVIKERTGLKRFSAYYVMAARKTGDYHYEDYRKSILKIRLNPLAKGAARNALKYYEEAIAVRMEYKTGMNPIELKALMERADKLREFLGK
jgi:tetratricopeptide (TPR) repeat protein